MANHYGDYFALGAGGPAPIDLSGGGQHGQWERPGGWPGQPPAFGLGAGGPASIDLSGGGQHGQWASGYSGYLNENARMLNDYLTNYGIGRTAQNDYWSRLQDLANRGLLGAQSSRYQPSAA